VAHARSLGPSVFQHRSMRASKLLKRERVRFPAPIGITTLRMKRTRRPRVAFFIEIAWFIWDANPSYDVYQEFTKRHFQVTC
jgi:hypothetical protein